MKINNGRLKQMIAEEMAKFNEKADPGKLNPKIPFKLSDTDMDAAKVIATAGDDDGSTEDDTIDVKVGASFAAKDLKPSQSTMSIANAAGMALAMLAGRMKYKDADLGGFIASDGHILDGHHRWIATLMVDPTANVKGALVQFPSKAIIPVLNTITKGLGGINTGKVGKGSFSEFTEKSILGKLLDFAKNGIGGKHPVAPEQIQQDMAKATGMRNVQQAAQALAKRFADNIASAGGPNFPVPEGAPDRIDMPVIGPDLKDQAIQALTQGLVDVNPPFGDENVKSAEDAAEGEQEMQESKKDMLKRIVAEEIAKMEIEALLDEKRGSLVGDLYRRAKASLGFGDKFWDGPDGIQRKFIPMVKDFIDKHEGTVEKVEYHDGSSYDPFLPTDEDLQVVLDDAKALDDEYTEIYKRGVGSDDAYYSMSKKQSDMYSDARKPFFGLQRRVYKAMEKLRTDKRGRERVRRELEAAEREERRLQRNREHAEYMRKQKEKSSSSSSSSGRKSGFDSWMQDDGAYDYMTRMENLSKQKLAKVVQEVLADMKK
jgi:hypothetical protein